MNAPKPNIRTLFVAMGAVAAVGLIYLLAAPADRPAGSAGDSTTVRDSGVKPGSAKVNAPGSAATGDPASNSMAAQWREGTSRDGVDPATTDAVAASSQAKEEVTIDLDPEARVPAALVQTHASIPLSPRQERLKTKITEQFLKDAKGAEKNPEAWDKARAAADERFRVLFGSPALQQQSVHAERVARGVE